jgi:hypothetical protein
MSKAKEINSPIFYFKINSEKLEAIANNDKTEFFYRHHLNCYMNYQDEYNGDHTINIITMYITIEDYKKYVDKVVKDDSVSLVYNAKLDMFYNYLNSSYHNLYKLLNEHDKRLTKGLAHTLLCHLLKYLITSGPSEDKTYLKLDDVMILYASGKTHKEEENNIGLYKMYESLGFKVIYPKYMERYEELCKYTKRDEINNYLNELIENGEEDEFLEDLYKKYNVDLSRIPLYAKISDLLEICKSKPKQIVDCINIKEPKTCRIILK